MQDFSVPKAQLVQEWMLISVLKVITAQLEHLLKHLVLQVLMQMKIIKTRVLPVLQVITVHRVLYYQLFALGVVVVLQTHLIILHALQVNTKEMKDRLCA